MANYNLDFVGLNSFVYEMAGWGQEENLPKYASFAAAESYVKVGDSETWNGIIGAAGTNKMTFSFWFYAKGWGGGGYGRIFDFGGEIQGYVSSSGRFVFIAKRDGDYVVWQTATNTISLNKWHHVAVRHNGTNPVDVSATNILIDGEIKQGFLGSHNPDAVTEAIDGSFGCIIGNRGSDLARAWNGYIDEFSVWSDSYETSFTVAEIFAAGRRTSLRKKTFANTSLEFWCRLASLELKDLSGNERDVQSANKVTFAKDTSFPSAEFKEYTTTAGQVQLFNNYLNFFGPDLTREPSSSLLLTWRIPRTCFRL